MSTESVGYAHNGVLLSLRKEEKQVVCDNMGGPRGHEVNINQEQKDKCSMPQCCMESKMLNS
jgi:hypothetical protein